LERRFPNRPGPKDADSFSTAENARSAKNFQPSRRKSNHRHRLCNREFEIIRAFFRFRQLRRDKCGVLRFPIEAGQAGHAIPSLFPSFASVHIRSEPGRGPVLPNIEHSTLMETGETTVLRYQR
jgi:hypothetical protein